MSSENGTPEEHNLKVIWGIVQRGKADRPVQAALRAGAQSPTVSFGRGMGVRQRMGILGLAIQEEKEIIAVVVEDHLMDGVLRAMVRAGNLDQPGVGFLFVLPVDQLVSLGLPNPEAAAPPA